LFRSVEAAATDRVALLGIVPDAKSGIVQISAEASDAETISTTQAARAAARTLQVYLLQHERERQNAVRRSVSW